MTRPFTMIAAIIFAVMAVAHAYRLLNHFPVVVGGRAVTETISIVAIVITAVLAIGLFREARR